MTRLCAMLACVIAATASADLTFTVGSVDRGRPETIRLQFRGEDALFTSLWPRKLAVLRDAKKQRTFVINPDAKTYNELNAAALTKLKEQVEQTEAALSKQLSAIPPTQRARVEATIPKPPNPFPTSQRRGYTFQRKGTATRTVAGRPCDEYLVKVDGVPDGECCFISWKDAGFGKELVRSQVLSALENLPLLGSSALDPIFAANNAPGLLGWRKVVDSATHLSREMTLSDVSTSDLSAETFQVPAGFTVRSGLPLGLPPPAP